MSLWSPPLEQSEVWWSRGSEGTSIAEKSESSVEDSATHTASPHENFTLELKEIKKNTTLR